MAAVALPSSKTPVFNPFHMASHNRLNAKAQQLSPHVGPSSRSPEPSTSSQASAKEVSESAPKTFKRLRSSLEQSLRSATRSKSKPAPPIDDFATISPAKSTKGKEKISGDYLPPKEKEKTNMLRRLESKVGLRRAGRESVTPSPSPMPPPATGAAHVNNMDNSDKVRAAGYTSFITPSLRQASMSSPALHFSGSPSKPPSASSSSSTAATPRDRARRSSVQPTARDISSPSPLVPRREGRGNGHASPTPNGGLKQGKARPSPIFVPPPGSQTPGRAVSPESNSRKDCELPSPPDTPTPIASSRGQLSNLSKKRTGASATHLPLNSPPASPTPASTHSVTPTRARSPVRSPSARRVITPTHRGLTSASATHLPLVSASPPTSPPASRRPSIDAPRRPSIDSPRRPSIDSPRRPSIDASRRHAGSPIPRAVSPSAAGRPRAASPSQRASPAYAQNRHFNVSTASLVIPSNPEQRDLIRTATSILCKEFRKAPAHLNRSEGQKDWAEVEIRMRPLIRLERIWGKSGAVAGSSSGQVNATGGGMSSTGFSVAGEERERRLFGEALRDGVVLCQLINKFRPNTIARIDPREDGVKRTSNVTKFLASCPSQGVPSDDLFYRDDIIENTPETLTRVARTIIALVKVVENPTVNRTKVIAGQGKPSATNAADRGGPYAPGSISRAASSTPNLVAQMERSVSPAVSPTGRKRWSPPSPALPTVRSDSPASGASSNASNGTARNGGTKNGQNTPVSLNDRELDDVPPIMGPSPPPRSPLRSRSQSKHPEESHQFLLGGARPLETSERSPMGSNGHFPGDYSADPPRQSRTSSNLTDTTAYSSLLEFRRNSSSGNNKFGTIRTMTTEATSFASEMPSFTRTEASSVAASLADEMNRKRGGDNGGKIVRERRPSESAAVDLTSLAEEEEVSASGSSSRDAKKVEKPRQGNEQQPKESEKVDHARAIRLGKGKWPDDFLDAFQQPPSSPPRAIPMKNSSSDRESSPFSSSPLSASPARKLAIVGASRHNDSGDSVQHTARRPSHRARHSIDAPILMPKESILRRDVSPDAASVVNSRVMLRRQSTRAGAAPHRNGVYYPRGSLDDPRESGESLVPFPRAVSGEHGARALSPTPSPDTPNSADRQSKNEAPRMRGRFQSEIEGSSARRRSRPSSYDELGKTRRSRFESMINLGVASSNASASDLLSRDSMDGSAVRQTLVVKEEGKPATHFQLGNCIGRGQFGSVYRALNLNTGQMVAVKRIRLEGLKEDEVTQLMKEVDLVKSLSHPSIVKYEGMARDEDTLNIVLEYAENGSLGQTLKAFGKLNERLVASYVVKILEGLHYLHRCDVVHCDLKAANILTTKNGNVKLSDFGVSLNLRAMEREIKDVAGTPNWMAPEVIELKGASTKSDIWSLACTVIELLTGRPPYAEIANSMTVMFRIVEDQMPPLPEGCSEPLQDFLKQCFHKDPVMRPSAELLCEHYWLKKNWDALKELRPQDSIPFLRRVSADIQKSDVARYLAQMDMAYAETPLPESPSHDIPHGSPPGRRRLSNGPNSPIGVVDESFSPREHTFVKTTFSKPMICRVCLTSVKKSAVICEQCSLIAHSKCAHNAPPTCDLRSQLLLYAQYAEKGNPGSAYSNPMEGLNVSHPPTHTSTNPMSEVSFVTPSPRPSMDVSSTPVPGQGSPVNPPTAFKFIAAFKRSRSSLSVEPGPPHSASPSPAPQPHKEDKVVKKRLSKLKRNQDARDRPHSLSSNSTSKNESSMRSGPTAPDSYSSRQEPGRKSFLSVTDDAGRSRLSATESEDPRKSSALSASAVTEQRDVDYGVPGALPAEPDRRKKRDRDKSAGCTLQ